LLGDIRYRDGSYIRPFDVARLELSSHRPKPPHVEDWLCDFVRERPGRVGRLEGEERTKFLVEHAVPGGEGGILAAEYSLVLCAPLPTAASFALDEYSGKYDARVFVPGVEEGRGMPVTDLKWRALGRSLLSRGENPLKLSAANLRGTVGVEKVYLALGLSRLHEGRRWPLVVGVHTLPDYEAEVDHSRP
jgi:hypothetical protein